MAGADVSRGDLAGRLAPVAPRSLAELAYDSIRESVIEGRLRPGERLVETQLASELGMSRAPIREALGRLAREHLVDERPRLGTFVRSLTSRDIIDIYNLRFALEQAAVRLFVRAGAPTAPLRAAVEAMRDRAAADDLRGTAAAELGFHEALCEGSGNAYLMTVFRQLEAQIAMALALDDGEYADAGDIAEEHLPVIEAIESGDEAEAVREISDHVMSSVSRVVERLGGDSSQLLGGSGREA
jgi:DNA-binding GntR family transcriptional regulator